MSIDRRTRPLMIAIGVLAGIAGCSQEAPKAAEKKAAPMVTVKVDRPVTREVSDFEEFVGQTVAVNTIEVRARVTGYLQKIDFADGIEVEKDAILFEIDPRSYQAEVARTQAAIVQGEAHLKRLELDHRRAQSLMAREVLPREEYDKINGDFAEAGAAVGILKANYDLAKLNLDFTKVTAPISGRMSRRMVDVGNLVRADDTLLTTIVSLDPMYVYFDIDERTLLKIRRLIREGKMKSREEAEIRVDVALADEKDFPHQATINFSENRIDPGTGTLRARAVLPNPKPTGSALGLRVFSPGMFTRIRLPIGDPKKALLLPEKALVTNQGEKSIFVVDKDSVARRRKVTIGALHEGLRVIETGLAPGEDVVVEGLQRMTGKEGTPVKILKEEKAAAPLVAKAVAPSTPEALPAPVNGSAAVSRKPGGAE